MKVCILGASFGNDNLGVGALAAGTIRSIVERHPDAEITILDYGYKSCQFDFRCPGQQVRVRFVNIRFSKKLHLRNNIALLLLIGLVLKVVPSKKLRSNIIAKNPILREICGAHLVASLAGGDSFSDIYGLSRLIYIALPQYLALLLGKKLILLPQTIGPFQGRIAKAIAKSILSRAELIYSRDYAGVEEVGTLLRRSHNSNKIRFCYDVGFVVDPIPPSSLDVVGLPQNGKRHSSVVGLNISGLLFVGGYRRNNMFELKTEYAVLVLKLIDFLITKKRAAILLVPHVYGAGKGHESDALVCKQTYEILQKHYGDRIGLASGTYDQSEIKYIIGLCSFFIGSRMHACIAALSQNIPSVSVAYSDKFVRVMQTIGLEHAVADPRRMDSDEILAVVEQAYDRRAQLREQLEMRIPRAKEMIFNLFDDVALHS